MRTPNQPTTTPAAQLIVATLQLNNKPMTYAEIDEATGLHRDTARMLVSHLEAAGLVSRKQIKRNIYVAAGSKFVGALPDPDVRQQKIVDHLRTAPIGPSIERTAPFIADMLGIGDRTVFGDLDDLRLRGYVRLDGDNAHGLCYRLGWELPAERYYVITKWRAMQQASAHNSLAAYEGRIVTLSKDEQAAEEARRVVEALRNADLFAVDDQPDLDVPEHLTYASQGFGPGNTWLSDLEIAIATGMSIDRVNIALCLMGEHADRPWFSGVRIGIGDRNGVPVYRHVYKGFDPERVGQHTGVEVIS